MTRTVCRRFLIHTDKLVKVAPERHSPAPLSAQLERRLPRRSFGHDIASRLNRHHIRADEFSIGNAPSDDDAGYINEPLAIGGETIVEAMRLLV
jgi:hypothetical protein